MVLEPTFRRPIVGTDAFDFGPEPNRVVHLPEMHEFVVDQVVADMVRGLDDPPIQGNRGVAGTGAPAAALVPHGDPADVQSVGCRELMDSGWQFQRRQLP